MILSRHNTDRLARLDGTRRAPTSFPILIVLPLAIGCMSSDQSPNDRAIVRQQTGKKVVNGTADPGSCRTNYSVLQLEPEAIEPELLEGKWLVFVYSELVKWDVGIAAKVPLLADRLAPGTRLAVRPCLSLDNVDRWLPTNMRIDTVVTPLWVVLEKGKIVRWYAGVLDFEQARAFAETGLPESPFGNGDSDTR